MTSNEKESAVNCVERGLQVRPPGVTDGCHGKSVCMHIGVHSAEENVHTIDPSTTLDELAEVAGLDAVLKEHHVELPSENGFRHPVCTN